VATPKFKRHFNRAMGKYYHTEKDLRSDMKAQGLEFKTGEVKQRESKPYEKSEWSKAMLQDIKNRKGRAPGDRFINELAKRGYTREAADAARRLSR